MKQSQRVPNYLQVFFTVVFIFSINVGAIELDGVKGFGIDTRGGLDGRVIKVTSLGHEGPGTLSWALDQDGPRVVVFEVGGVINLQGNNLTVTKPFLTIAGETAPKPGITLIRGGLSIRAHDVKLSHLMVRPGDNNQAKRSGWGPDAISVAGANAYRVHIDHCSLTWAVDENASASGPRDKGHEATSKQITFSNNIIAEGLDYATHEKGKHSKGLLVHDYVQDVAVVGNLFAHNDRRNPYFKGHTNGVVVNNLLYNIGNAAVQLGYVADEYQHSGLKPANPRVNVVGNLMLYGRDSFSDLALIAHQGDVYAKDNQVINLDGENMPLIYGDIRILPQRVRWPEGMQLQPVNKVKAQVLKYVGARPWDRDPIDRRIVDSVLKGSGRIIDSQDEVGGYPAYKPARHRLEPPSINLEAWLQKFKYN